MKQAHLVAQKHDNHRKDAPPFIVKQRLCWFTSDQSVLCPLLELSYSGRKGKCGGGQGASLGDSRLLTAANQ